MRLTFQSMPDYVLNVVCLETVCVGQFFQLVPAKERILGEAMTTQQVVECSERQFHGFMVGEARPSFPFRDVLVLNLGSPEIRPLPVAQPCVVLPNVQAKVTFYHPGIQVAK